MVGNLLLPLLANLRAYWKPLAVLLAFAALALWGAIGWSGKRHAELIAQNERKTYEAAQAEAARHALDMARRKDAENLKLKDDADARYDTLADDYRERLARFMRGQNTAAARAAGNPDLPRDPGAPASPDGPGEAAQLHQGVCLKDEDANTLILNQARLEAAHEWALKLEAANGR
jgi:hypothetical protein